MKLKKKITITALIVTMAMLLSGCCMQHEWQDATCTEPKTCAKCGKTEGEALGHQWTEATCTEPKTCSVCGETEGEALDHQWVEATCTEPKTCSVCGTTEGDALGHTFAPASLTAPKTCTVCGATEGVPVTVKEIKIPDSFSGLIINEAQSKVVTVRAHSGEYGNIPYAEIFDFDGNSLTTWEFPAPDGWYTYYKAIDCDAIMYCCLPDSTGIATLYIYDLEGNILYQNDYDAPKKSYFMAEPDSGLLRVYDTEDDTTLFCFDPSTKKEISEADYEASLTHDRDNGENSQYAFYGYEDAFGLHLVETLDESSWGYIDSDGNEVAMFKDASAFTNSGYALVSNDGENYDLIDTDMNVVIKGIAQGKSASLEGYGEYNVLAVVTDDSYRFFQVK